MGRVLCKLGEGSALCWLVSCLLNSHFLAHDPIFSISAQFNSGLMYALLLGAAAFCVQKAPRELLRLGREVLKSAWVHETQRTTNSKAQVGGTIQPCVCGEYQRAEDYTGKPRHDDLYAVDDPNAVSQLLSHRQSRSMSLVWGSHRWKSALTFKLRLNHSSRDRLGEGYPKPEDLVRSSYHSAKKRLPKTGRGLRRLECT